MSGLHSPGPPSSSARRAQCPQSSTLEALYPEEDSPDAADGVAAHWAAAEQLHGRLIDVGQIAPNGVVLTPEMVQGADLMFDEVTRTLKPYGVEPHQCQIETTVRIPRVNEAQFGSPDCYITLAGRPIKLFLWDYKFGHRLVEVFENLQLVEYAAGVVGHVPDLDPGVEIVFTIVQPRSYHRDGPVRRWTTTLKDLRALINIAKNSWDEAFGPNPSARVGPECRDCKARHACPKLQAEGFAAMEEAGRIAPLDMPPAQAGLELKMLKRAERLMKARITGLEQQLLALGKRGEPLVGWKLQASEGREQWAAPAAQVAALGDMMRLDLRKPLDVLTPRQAREKGLDPEMVAAMAKRTAGAMVLEESTDADARRIFG